MLERAGSQCQAIIDGEQCEVTNPALLEAHHLDALRDHGRNDPDRGVCLCRHHHAVVEAHARQNADTPA